MKQILLIKLWLDQVYQADYGNKMHLQKEVSPGGNKVLKSDFLA